MVTAPTVYSKAITFVEFEKSGNPQEKYKAGGGLLSLFASESMQSGNYLPYMDQVVSETTLRFKELEEEIAFYNRATFSLSLEHTNPEAYHKMRIIEALEDF